MRTTSTTLWTWLPPAMATLLIAIVYLGGLNQSLFLALNHFGHSAGEHLWVNLTILGDGAVALALVLPCIRRSPQRFWAALIAALITGIGIYIAKQVFSLPRPLSVLPVEKFFQYGPKLRLGSFPSGHAATIFTLAGIWILSLRGHQLVRALLFLLAVLVALSRTMVGVHWPLDILAGMLIGWVSAWVALRVSAYLDWSTSGIAGFAGGCILLVVTGALVLHDHTGYTAARPLQIAVGMVCLVWGISEMARMLANRSTAAGGSR